MSDLPWTIGWPTTVFLFGAAVVAVTLFPWALGRILKR